MRLWVDDIRPAPEGWFWAKSVFQARIAIEEAEALKVSIELISLDHDAGRYYGHGGDYIRLLDWLEETGCSYPHPHSQRQSGRNREYEKNYSTEQLERGVLNVGII